MRWKLLISETVRGILQLKNENIRQTNSGGCGAVSAMMEVSMTKQNLRLWTVRVIELLIGLTIAHLGVTLFLQADLGSDPFNVLLSTDHTSTLP